MKTMMLLLILLAPLRAHALTENPPAGEPELGRCYQNGAVFFHHVVGKIGPHRYEIASEIYQLGHGVLKTKRPLSPGLVALPMKYTGKKKMELANGFTAQVRQWEECK